MPKVPVANLWPFIQIVAKEEKKIAMKNAQLSVNCRAGKDSIAIHSLAIKQL
jgi:hypothetical protein